MKKLINMLLAGKSIITSKGTLTFDKDGICVLEDETAYAFRNINGFSVEDDLESTDKADDAKISEQPENKLEDDPSTPDDGEDVSLDSLSVPSLKKYAKDHGIDISGLNTKEPILKAIKAASQR